MAVTLNGYAKAINPQTQIREGLDQLRNASKEKAQEHLTQLRSDLQSKTGVVRLLHTTSTDANQEMKFKNAGGFKSMFLNGNKLKQSGQVIRDLLKSAGLSETKVKEFDAYVNARGGQGVKAQKVLRYIDAMRSEKGHSADEVLSKFGVDLGTAGRTLGEGAFGSVRTVRYRGEEFVYKEPSEKAIKKGYDVLEQLQLTDASGQPVRAKNAKVASENDDKKSYASYSGNSLIKDPSPLQKLNNRHSDHGNKGNVSHSSDSSKLSVYKENNRNSGGVFHNFMLQNLQENDFFKPEPSEHSQANSLEKFDFLLSQPEPLIEEEPDEAQPLVSAQPSVQADQAHEVQPPQQEPPLPAAASMLVATGPQLGRTGIANAIRVKDLPQVITPTAVVVRETASNGDEQYHAVAGQKTFKDWARTQPTSSELDVVGLLMPKAVGKQLIEYPGPAGKDKNLAPPKVHVSRSDLKPMAASALNLVQGMASHGFIHGDIKPENLMWDSKSKTLQLIDTDGLLKVSKKAGTQIDKGLGIHSLVYTNPVAWDKRYASVHPRFVLGANAQLGLGRDLFSIGVVLLEASLRAKGHGDKFDTLISRITYAHEPSDKAKHMMFNQYHKNGIADLKAEPFANESVENFARTCIIEAIRHEEDRLDNHITTFERYNTSQPGNDQHLLSKLARQFAELA